MSATEKITKRDLTFLSAYLDGELSSKDLERIERRLESEPALQARLEEMKGTRALLESVPVVRLPRQFTLTPEMVSMRKPVRGFPILQFATVAVAIAFVAVVGIDFLMLQAPMGALESDTFLLRAEQEVGEAKEALAEEAPEEGFFAEAPAEAAPPVAEPEAEAPAFAGAQDEALGEEEEPSAEEPLLEAAPVTAEEEIPPEPEEGEGIGEVAERNLEAEPTQALAESEIESEDVDQTFADAVEVMENTPTPEDAEDRASGLDQQAPLLEAPSRGTREVAIRILEVGLGGLALVLLILTIEAKRRG